MRKREIAVKTFIFLSLLCLCANAWPAESRIPELTGQLSALEGQKTEFEAEREKLIAEGDELSLKIEALKIQSRGGLGIIGRYRLSRSLRKAQALAEKIQALEKNINELENRLKDKRSELGEEYKNQIAILLGKLDAASEAEEKREILEKLKEYQAAKEQLAKPEKRELGYLDLSKIEIREDDGPQEIREKADLINDFASKLDRGIEMLDAQMKRLQEEVETRKKLGEFAEEISFFGERISREQIADSASGESNAVFAEDSDAETTEIAAVKQLTDSAAEPRTATWTEEPPVTQPPTETGEIVVEHNGVSVSFLEVPLDQFEEQIRLLENRKQELKKKLSELSEKADSFYKRADEIEKSETKAGEKKR